MANNLRFQVVEEAFKKRPVEVKVPKERPSQFFGKYVFDRKKMYKYLPKDIYDTMIDVAEEMFNIEIRKKAGTGQEGGSYGIAPYGTAGRGRGCVLNFVSEAIIARMGTLFKGK